VPRCGRVAEAFGRTGRLDRFGLTGQSSGTERSEMSEISGKDPRGQRGQHVASQRRNNSRQTAAMGQHGSQPAVKAKARLRLGHGGATRHGKASKKWTGKVDRRADGSSA
jgi:hypothetical protein